MESYQNRGVWRNADMCSQEIGDAIWRLETRGAIKL